jgi:hypothetical protein
MPTKKPGRPAPDRATFNDQPLGNAVARAGADRCSCAVSARSRSCVVIVMPVLRRNAIRLGKAALGQAQNRTLWHECMVTLARIALRLIEDALRWMVLLFRSTEALRAENLFLRRQLALYIERGVQARRIDAATRVSLVVLANLFDWRSALVVTERARRARSRTTAPTAGIFAEHRIEHLPYWPVISGWQRPTVRRAACYQPKELSCKTTSCKPRCNRSSS